MGRIVPQRQTSVIAKSNKYTLMFNTNNKYHVIATVDGIPNNCTLEYVGDEWRITCPWESNDEKWSSMISATLEFDHLETIQPYQDTGKFCTSMRFKIEDERLIII